MGTKILLIAVLITQAITCTDAFGQESSLDSIKLSAQLAASDSGLPELPSRYQPAPDGFRIVGGQGIFNRVIYGGHAQDDLQNRYYTFAGDQPLFMGSIIKTVGGGSNAKCGTLMLGVSQSYGTDSDNKYGAPSYGAWFHECRDNVAVFRNGWWEYQIALLLVAAPEVTASVEVFPLSPEDGFLVHFRVTPQSGMVFCAGFGGITDYLGLLTNRGNKPREVASANCRGNLVHCGVNRALLEGPHSKMWVGANFAADVSIGDANAALTSPCKFLARDAKETDVPMLRIARPIGAGETLDGVIVVVRNQDEKVLDAWLNKKDPVGDLKRAIREKQQALIVETPDQMLNLTIPANVVGMDACWNKSVFCHGGANWHSPYAGWRICYGPTVLGWHDRVVSHFLTHADPTRFTIDEKHGDGYISPDLHGRGFGYNMQEVAIDMLLHNLEWTGDLKVASDVFDRIAQALRYESRMFDPDDNGLYQNFLNTWVSDGHPYNGGDCTQSSAYNYRANRLMGIIAAKLGRDPKPFVARADKINRAMQQSLWLPEKGVFAEYKDTIGNQLIHPSPELATIYHTIECGLADPFQAYQLLRFTRAELRNEQTLPRRGRLVWSSNWYPRNFSACSLFAGENIHLAWAYFRSGQTAEGVELLRGLVDAHFMGDAPGSVGHMLNSTGMSEGTQDFADTTSMYLRLIVEGLFGVNQNLLEDRIDIAPGFPKEWANARLKANDFSLAYHREGLTEELEFYSQRPGRRYFRLPMRGVSVASVTLNGQPIDYHIEPMIGRSDILVDTSTVGVIKLRVAHGEEELPSLKVATEIRLGTAVSIAVEHGKITEVKDPSGVLSELAHDEHEIRGTCDGEPGAHTLFVRVRSNSWDGWLPAHFLVRPLVKPQEPEPTGTFESIDIAEHFNAALTDIHQREYVSPRPTGLSLMTNRNGRYAWDDSNLGGPRTTQVDDSRLRTSGGVFKTASGIPFGIDLTEVDEKDLNYHIETAWTLKKKRLTKFST